MKKTRKLVLCIISLVLCLNLVYPNVSATEIVQDTILNTGWNIDENQYFSCEENSIKYNNSFVRSNVPSFIYKTDSVFSNGHIRFDIKAENAKDFGIVFRRTENNYYVLKFDYDSNKLRLVRKVDAVSESVVKSVPIALKEKKTYKVDVGLLGSTFKITVDEKEYILFKDEYLYEGQIGFTASLGKIEVSNIEFYEKPDEVYESYVDDKVKPVKIYLAPNGSDVSGNGSYDKPFETVDQAMILARKAMAQKKPADIIFKEGDYVLDETLVFSEKHSGTAITPITFKAEEGKKVEFSGATRINEEDFELVTDPNITARLYPDVVGKVYQIDLAKQGISREQVDWVSNYNELSEVKEVPCTTKLLVNNRLQTLSRWPNDNYAVIGECELGGTGNNDFGGSISFTDETPLRWTKAKDMYVGGMLYVFWYEEWVPVETVDVEQMKIKMATGSQYGFRKDQLWAAYNLLEEIDMPGEWYVDYDTMMLYLYPTEKLSKDDIVEITTQKHGFFELNGIKYANFEGFTFENNAGKLAKMSGSLGYDGAGIAIRGDTRNITIKNCKFSNLGGKGIVTGYYGSSSAWDMWRTNVNILIDGCDFINCRLKGVELGGGRVSSMQESGITVSNCFFYGSGVTVGALRQSHGMTFKNNVVSHVDNYAVYGIGSQLRILNNEISFCCYNKADMGTIYLGRMLTFHQTNIDNNYIHHFGSGLGEEYRAAAIYLDDCAGGITVRNNISVAKPNSGMTTALTFGGGPDVEISGNLSVDAADGFYIQNRVAGSNGYLVNPDYSLDQSMQRINSENFSAKFPGIKRHLACLDKQYLNYDMQSVFKDNITYNCVASDTFTHWDKLPYPTGTFEKSADLTETGDKKDIFVDADNHDYRIKDSIVKKYNLSEIIPKGNYDVENMGTRRNIEIDEELNNFKITAPSDGETSKFSNRVVLAWEMCEYGDEYIYEIATDENFENVVVKGKTFENGVTLEQLNPETEYFVRVKAISYMKQGFEKNNINNVIRFKTSNLKYRNNGLLEVQLNKAKNTILPSITEGTEAGQYYEGTIELVENEIKANELILANENATQDEINKAAEELEKLEQKISSRVNVCYVPLELNANDSWTKVGGITDIKYKNGAFVITGGESLGTVSLDKILSNFEVVCFKYRITNFTKSFVTFGLRLQNPSALHYSDSSNYILFKPDVFEVQKRGTIYEKGENKGYTSEGQWHDAELGCITTDAGINFYFKVDGEIVSDYLDTDNPQYNPGRFAMCVPPGATIEIMPSDKVPDGLYQLSDKTKDLIKNGIIEKYDISSNIFSVVSGNWTQDINEINSSEKGATVQFDYIGENAAIYRVAYYHKPSPENDSKGNVTVTLPTGKVIDSENYYTVTVTDSKGVAKADTTVTLKDRKNGTATGTTDKNGMLTLPATKHKAYIVGYDDGTFKPDSNMSRAEAAAIFARLIAEAKDETVSGKSSFADVSSKEWYSSYIGYLEKYDVINGYNDGTFRPEDNVTRAEFVTMAVRYYEIFNEVKKTDYTVKYTDVSSNYWAYTDIAFTKNIGWLNGYADGTFKGDNNITRAEVVTVTNHATGRTPDEDYITKNATTLNRFTDLKNNSHWAYNDIMEAANTHKAVTYKDSETWVK